jgi:hypothetical protein
MGVPASRLSTAGYGEGKTRGAQHQFRQQGSEPPYRVRDPRTLIGSGWAGAGFGPPPSSIPVPARPAPQTLQFHFPEEHLLPSVRQLSGEGGQVVEIPGAGLPDGPRKSSRGATPGGSGTTVTVSPAQGPATSVGASPGYHRGPQPACPSQDGGRPVVVVRRACESPTAGRSDPAGRVFPFSSTTSRTQ